MSDPNPAALLTSLRSANLIPSAVIPEDFAPSLDLTVAFGPKSVNNGNLFRVSDVKAQPEIGISQLATSSDDAATTTYTFMMIDPDAPTPADPKFAYWRHWVVANIKVPASSGDIVDHGTTITPYLAPGPKDESGPHRYHFLLFKEPKGWQVKSEDVGGNEFVERRSFKPDDFTKKNGLELVGMQWMRGVGDGWKE